MERSSNRDRDISGEDHSRGKGEQAHQGGGQQHDALCAGAPPVQIEEPLPCLCSRSYTLHALIGWV